MNWQKATCEVCGASFDHLKKRRPHTCNNGECQYKYHYQVDRREWASYQELTERRISLYNDEVTDLEAIIKDAEEQTTSAEREISGIRSDIQVLRSATQVVTDSLPALEQKVRELYAYFPSPLKDKVTPLVQKLGTKKMPTSDRMALIIGVLNEVDKFNTDFTHITDEIKIGNETKLVDVLYLGVAVAYYADKEGKRARSVPGVQLKDKKV